jgi:hypothetical protein
MTYAHGIAGIGSFAGFAGFFPILFPLLPIELG